MTGIPDLEPVKAYFDQCLREHGPTPRGVDWSSETSQKIRFDQLLKVVELPRCSILDYGCGYGAMADYLAEKGIDADYFGFDILESAIHLARQINAGKPRRSFFSHPAELTKVDYVVASGIFNVRCEKSFDAWTEYVIGLLIQFNSLCLKGFSSNFLTKYSDLEHMRPDLYYADPCFLFDYCKNHFSKNVALLHDYHLYDFTLIVRKE
jgi:SAM-dependent methyltransferase